MGIKMGIKNAKKLAHGLEATVKIGKQGLTSSIVEEIKLQLKKRKVIKVKILKSYISDKEKEDVFAELAHKTNARIVHKVGFTVVLAKNI